MWVRAPPSLSVERRGKSKHDSTIPTPPQNSNPETKTISTTALLTYRRRLRIFITSTWVLPIATIFEHWLLLYSAVFSVVSSFLLGFQRRRVLCMPSSSIASSVNINADATFYRATSPSAESDRGRRAQASKDKDGGTALHWAAKRGCKKVVLLLEKGADIKEKDKNGSTALSWSAGGEHKAVVEVLLGYGADVNAKDEDGFIALSWAAERGHEAVVEALLAHRVNISEKDKNGSTALHWAAMGPVYTPAGQGVMELLIENKADCQARNNDGKTALDLFKMFNGSEFTLRV